MAIDRQVLAQVMIDAIENIRRFVVKRRDIEIDPNMPTVFVGIRRAGKSFLMYQIMQDLVAKGMDWSQFLYINFEDERLIGFSADEFNTLLEIQYARTEREPILFLDEIQVVDGWERFARRMADEKRRIYLTGSNAAMLSKDIASRLGGRFLTCFVFPYSFAEYLNALGELPEKLDHFSTSARGRLQRRFMPFLSDGGFPELTEVELTRDYLSNLFSRVYLGDILVRNNLTNSRALEMLIKKMAEAVGRPISYTRLANMVKSAGINVGKSTVIDYVSYAQDAQLVFNLENIAAKLTDRMMHPKFYFMDNGLLNLFLTDAGAALLENLVALQLVRDFGREGAVAFYHQHIEVDFFVEKKGLAIQVAYSLADTTTLERETIALCSLAKQFPCQKLLILTLDETRIIQREGRTIEVMPVWKWLLDSTNPSPT